MVSLKFPTRVREKFWQIFLSIHACLVFVPSGLMLGWPSPTYPYLLKSDSIVPITIDQSAMITGFLLLGNTIGTPFSSIRKFSAKASIISALMAITIGWMLMWQATDIYYLCGSRLLIGIANGFGIGQLRIYIEEICQKELKDFLMKQINLYLFLGIVLAFAVGPFVDFICFGLICFIISIFALFFTFCLPSTPADLVRNQDYDETRKFLAFLKPQVNPEEEIKVIQQYIEEPKYDLSWGQVFGNPSLRRKMIILGFLVLFQQMSGFPATVAYSQIIFTDSHCHYPEFCAIAYVTVLFFATIYGAYYATTYNKKIVFILSSLSVSLVLGLNVCALIYAWNETFWEYTSLVIMCMYMMLHTIGLGNIPFSLIPDLFPKNARKIAIHFFVMLYYMLALTITKTFQVLYADYGLVVPFCLFLVISFLGSIFALIFIPFRIKRDHNIITTNNNTSNESFSPIFTVTR